MKYRCDHCGKEIEGSCTLIGNKIFCYEDDCWEAMSRLVKELRAKKAQQLIREGRCIFYREYTGHCKDPVVEGEYYCEEHQGLRCTYCKKQAETTIWDGLRVCEECAEAIRKGGEYYHDGKWQFFRKR
ncbi:MAG: hypothetical protein WC157_01215 [Candidatus Paceibacterota bacterium]